MDVAHLSLKALLELQSAVMVELRDRGVARSTNNPVGDLARHLFAKAFGWTLQSGSTAGFDAISRKGSPIRIRGRRLLDEGEANLSNLGDPASWSFTWLAAAVFDRNYDIVRAAVIPAATASAGLVHQEASGEHSFVFRASVLSKPGVFDASAKLTAALGPCELRSATPRTRRNWPRSYRSRTRREMLVE